MRQVLEGKRATRLMLVVEVRNAIDHGWTWTWVVSQEPSLSRRLRRVWMVAYHLGASVERRERSGSVGVDHQRHW